ncbi:hypothetical protein O9H85_34640 [Paenibacillus filicis]|uniref:MrpR C-terminal catalytic domain-containing protein n=1 Tax=Paenibacillus gyeongsangnamensis TaxID=3388067 RepID=A0ABT4QKK3_9BACL|nr:hypothetical protein [Paenibacillus filicis]MCZ8517398.1 hypothetical protein [Paenibacillus filicis]
MNVLTREKLLFIESQCVNPQDAIIIRLLMEGIEVHELVYLTQDALNETTRILTIESPFGTSRKIQVSKRCAELFQHAAEQTKYILENGYNPTKQNSVNLRHSPFLIKVSIHDYIANESMIMELDSVILRTIYMRLKKLAAFFSLPELVHLTTVRLEPEEKAYA